MGCLSLVLFCLACFAGDVVELEPVKALSFHCSLLKTAGVGDGGQANCQASPFCYWDSPDCKDDPCLVASNRVLNNVDDTCASPQSGSTCAPIDLSGSPGSVLSHDCTSTTPNSGILCTTTQARAQKQFDYCAYAYIRDQKCPESICEALSTDVGCVPHNQGHCELLSQKDCALVPKCYWDSSCKQDPCFAGSEGKNCAQWPGNDASAPVPLGDCVDFKPLKSGTTDIQIYCLHKNNKDPNICYFAGKNASASDTDYLQTYPTYDFNVASPVPKNPTCTGQLTGCEGTGDCYTTANSGGALAGLYCTDGTHGNASILRIPSILVFLIVSALSLFIL